MGCELCEAEKNKDGTYKDVHPWFFELICRTHNVPMLCLKKHQAKLTELQLMTVIELGHWLYKNRLPRGTGMTSIHDHWHEHYIEIELSEWKVVNSDE